MSYTQVITPDLNTVGDVGWCLAFVEKAFDDINYSYATAHDGWMGCQFIHKDQNLPADVCVPIWFDYYEGGINYGHVAIWVPGRGILSSPWRADNTQQWEPDIATIERVYNSKYLGWSEDLMGVRVVKEGDAMQRETVNYIFRGMLDREPTEEELKQWVGGDALLLARLLYNDPRNQQIRFRSNDYDNHAAKGMKPYSGPQLYVKE